MVEDRKTKKHLLSKTACIRRVFRSGFYTFLSLASALVIFHISRSCLYTSLYVFLGCSLTKLPPTSYFQYILDQEVNSAFFQLSSILSIFKMFKKRLNEIKKKKLLVLSLQIQKMMKQVKLMKFVLKCVSHLSHVLQKNWFRKSCTS